MRVLIFDHILKLDPQKCGDPTFIIEEWINNNINLNDIILLKSGLQYFRPGTKK